MSTYQCPKCYNILPVSNKILHDLKCTKESPVEFSQENPYTSSMDYNNTMRYTTNDYSNLRISSDFNLANEIRNSAGSRYYRRNSYMNDDGTTTEIKKETNMSGKEELLEITYDPQGNIIGRKKADGGRSSVKFNFHELQNYSTYDPMDNYNIYEGGNVYVQTVPTTEIVYEPIEPIETYTVDYSNINNNFEHDFGSRGYSLMDNNITSGQMVELNQNNYSTNNNYNNTQSFYDNNNNNEDLEKYFVENNSNSYINQTNNYNQNNNYNYNNSININYNTENYNNYFQTSSSSNNFNNSNNFNFESNNQNYENFKCAKVTKLN